MHDALLDHQLSDGIHSRKDRLIEKLAIISIVLLLLGDRLALGGKLLNRHIPKRGDAAQPPLRKRLIDHNLQSVWPGLTLGKIAEEENTTDSTI
jgi:hypothetical protein